MNAKNQKTDAEKNSTNIAKCAYTGDPVPTPNDVDVSISAEAVVEKIENGETRLTSTDSTATDSSDVHPSSQVVASMIEEGKTRLTASDGTSPLHPRKEETDTSDTGKNGSSE